MDEYEDLDYISALVLLLALPMFFCLVIGDRACNFMKRVFK